MIRIIKKTKKQWFIDSLIFLSTVFVACLYFVFNAPMDIVHVVKIGFDDLIPRIPIFIIPYLAFLPWFWLVVTHSYLSHRHFHELAYSVIATNFIAFLVYSFYQTYIPRDLINESDIFSQMLASVYANDRPYAGLPSLHSGLSAVVATYFLLNKSRWSWFFVTSAMLVVISTLFTKQHFILDAITGVSLGVIVTFLVFAIKSKIRNRNTEI